MKIPGLSRRRSPRLQPVLPPVDAEIIRRRQEMKVTTVYYANEFVAVATNHGYQLKDIYLRLPVDDPVRTWIAFTAMYAVSVMAGERPGPYNDEDARAWVRQQLIPLEFQERVSPNPFATAEELGVPVWEMPGGAEAMRARKAADRAAVAAEHQLEAR